MKATSTSMTRPMAVRPSAPAPIGQALVAFSLGLVLFVLLGSMVPALYNWRYAGLIYPGVSVHAIDLSGLTPDEAFLIAGLQLEFSFDLNHTRGVPVISGGWGMPSTERTVGATSASMPTGGTSDKSPF